MCAQGLCVLCVCVCVCSDISYARRNICVVSIVLYLCVYVISFLIDMCILLCACMPSSTTHIRYRATLDAVKNDSGFDRVVNAIETINDHVQRQVSSATQKCVNKI